MKKSGDMGWASHPGSVTNLMCDRRQDPCLPGPMLSHLSNKGVGLDNLYEHFWPWSSMIP